MIGENTLDKKQWKHKIGGNVIGTVLCFFMLAGAAALCIWFDKTGNGAILLGRIILVVFAVAFALSLYRVVFFKVLIGRDGFFYQSAPGNGRYYRYSELRNAWVSAGKETSSMSTFYLQFETREGSITRIAILEADTDAADYLVKRVAAVAASDATGMEDDQRDHIISGKIKGLTKIAVIGSIFAIVMWLSYTLFEEGLPPLTYALSAIAVFCAFVYVIMHYFFYRIEILRDGFYCRTNPFNGHSYKYRDISNCKLIESRKRYGSAYRRGVRETHYLDYLVFTDNTGKEHRIMYDKSLFEREMRILESRINKNHS